MRTATGNRQFRAIEFLDGDLSCFTPVFDFITTTIFPGIIIDIQHRYIDNTDDALVLVDERDIDGELAVTFDKFTGTIQRVDQPVARPLPPLRDLCLCGLF